MSVPELKPVDFLRVTAAVVLPIFGLTAGVMYPTSYLANREGEGLVRDFCSENTKVCRDSFTPYDWDDVKLSSGVDMLTAYQQRAAFGTVFFPLFIAGSLALAAGCLAFPISKKLSSMEQDEVPSRFSRNAVRFFLGSLCNYFGVVLASSYILGLEAGSMADLVCMGPGNTTDGYCGSVPNVTDTQNKLVYDLANNVFLSNLVVGTGYAALATLILAPALTASYCGFTAWRQKDSLFGSCQKVPGDDDNPDLDAESIALVDSAAGNRGYGAAGSSSTIGFPSRF